MWLLQRPLAFHRLLSIMQQIILPAQASINRVHPQSRDHLLLRQRRWMYLSVYSCPSFHFLSSLSHKSIYLSYAFKSYDSELSHRITLYIFQISHYEQSLPVDTTIELAHCIYASIVDRCVIDRLGVIYLVSSQVTTRLRAPSRD